MRAPVRRESRQIRALIALSTVLGAALAVTIGLWITDTDVRGLFGTAEARAEAAALECDKLGAHPDDPEAVAEGVADDRLNGAAVVEACRQALAFDTDAPRLRFQLARGLLKTGETEQAVEIMLPAAEQGHGGALALLGDIYLVGGGGGIEPDPALAQGLYQRAAEAGFAPARQVLAGFEDQTEAFAQAAAEAMFQPDPQSGKRYGEAEILAGVYRGDFDGIAVSERYAKVYLVNIAEGLQQMCQGSFNAGELASLKSSVIQPGDLSPEAGAAALMNMLLGLGQAVNDPFSLVQTEQGVQAFENVQITAGNDAMAFVEREGCEGETFDTFTRNLRAYVMDAAMPLNIVADRRFGQACWKGAQPTHYPVDQFCLCFLSRSEALSRGDKKALLADFWPAATRIMTAQPSHYGVCTGSLAR